MDRAIEAVIELSLISSCISGFLRLIVFDLALKRATGDLSKKLA